MIATLLTLLEVTTVLTFITICILNLILLVCSMLGLFCATDISTPITLLTYALEATPISLMHAAIPDIDPLSIVAKMNKTLHQCF